MSILKTNLEGSMETQKEQRSVGELIDLAFKAVAMGMSAAAIALGMLGMAPATLITLLAIGLFCLAVVSLK
jgi:type III secretory pathway component EscR